MNKLFALAFSVLLCLSMLSIFAPRIKANSLDNTLVVYVGAHPDDIDIGMSGSLYKYDVNNHPILWIVVTDGGADEAEYNYESAAGKSWVAQDAVYNKEWIAPDGVRFNRGFYSADLSNKRCGLGGSYQHNYGSLTEYDWESRVDNMVGTSVVEKKQMSYPDPFNPSQRILYPDSGLAKEEMAYTNQLAADLSYEIYSTVNSKGYRKDLLYINSHAPEVVAVNAGEHAPGDHRVAGNAVRKTIDYLHTVYGFGLISTTWYTIYSPIEPKPGYERYQEDISAYKGQKSDLCKAVWETAYMDETSDFLDRATQVPNTEGYWNYYPDDPGDYEYVVGVDYPYGRLGGPDSFGYKYMDSNALGGLAYDWIEISGTGTEVLPSSDDSWVGNINLGFFFNYYGTDYSQLAIGNNGLLFSGVGTSQYVNQPITQTPGIHGLIAPFWDDIVTWGSAGAIYYQTLGTAPNREFVVEWYDNQHYYSSTSGVTFEAVLYEGTNNILFQYKDVDFGSVSGSTGSDLPPYNNGGSATVGIEDPTGIIGLQYSFNEQAITPGLAILFKFPAFAGTNMYLSMNAPASMDHGSTMTYTLYYNDFGDVAAQNVVLQTTLSSSVDYVSASDSGTYDAVTRRVTWNIGTVPAFPSGRGTRTVTVTIPASVSVGTVIQTTASISTTTLETRIDDNTASTQTTVTGSSLPPNVGVGPTVGTVGGIPSIYWRTPIAFTYYSLTATGVDIRIHLDDGGSDITGSMTGGPPTWTYTTTFYPRTGHAAVTYTVLGNAGPIPALPSTIRVLRTATGQVEVINFMDYVKNVLPNEWIPSWEMNALKAGAIAVKTYAWYWTIHQKYPGQNYDVKDSTADQVYVPGTSNPRTNQAVEETWNWVMTKNGEVFQAQYDSGTSGSPDPLYPGRMSQWGTQYWAGTGKDWQWIVHYYYDPIEGPFVRSVTFNIYVDPAGYIYNVVTLQRISGASVWLQRSDGQGSWENVPTGQTPAIMQPDVNPQITGADGQYQWDVLEGSYRVHVEAPGYYPADSIVVIVPPPVTNLHVGLTPLPSPPDPVPPTTTLATGNPKYADPSGNVYVTSATPFTLSAEDNAGGSGVATTGYRIRNAASYNSGWTASAPPIEFYLTGLADGLYLIDYNSTDNVGNIESTQTISITLDNSGPLITIENPPAGWALQDGVTFIVSSSDASGTDSLNFSVREANGDQGIAVGFEDMPATYNATTGKWELFFNTLQLPDGFYTVLVNAEDNLGNTASITVPYSIRNWAVLEFLPATPNSKAGRTMPIKFALRVAASVEPSQPFVYNEELTIKIYATDNPRSILQTSTFGDTAKDYRINTLAEHYITNFQTLKTPKTYIAEIWRKDMLIGNIGFETVTSKGLITENFEFTRIY